MPTFVLNDEKVINSYGFRVINSGGSFERFDANPVMLNSHVNSPATTLGNWTGRNIKGSQLLGDSNFDIVLECAKEVSGQVDRGFIKGCSMGLGLSFSPGAWREAADGVLELIEWELMEASICAVPSNSSALALYNIATGELIPEDQFKLSLKNLSVNDLTKNTPNMEKIILTPLALSALLGMGITGADNVAEISRGIEKLQAELTIEKASALSLKTKLDEQVKLQAESLIDAAILDEKILKGDREEWLTFATANFSLASKQVAKMQGKASLSGQLQQTAGDASIKTIDEFEKLSDEKKLAFKNNNKEAYQKLFAA